MTSWFDSYAKRSVLAAAAASSPGMSRRRFMTSSAVVAGAWSAPLLTSSPAYASGVSQCPANRIRGTDATQLKFCCAGTVGTGGTHTCTVVNGVNGCSANGTLGGSCTNEGQGTSGCNSGGAQNIYCNGNTGQCTCGTGTSNTFAPNICGGYGSQCEGNAQCASGFTCLNAHYCAPTCCMTDPCGPGLICLNNVCRQPCTQKNDCPSRAASCTSIPGTTGTYCA